MTKLSPHFSLAEFTASDTARKIGNRNQPTAQHLRHLYQTAAYMEWVRSLFGRPLIITSGYRNPAVNRAVGGVPTSDHALGWAVDFHIPGETLLDVGLRIFSTGIPFDQLIGEWGRGVLHISFNPRMRYQLLTQRGGPGSAFEQGLRP